MELKPGYEQTEAGVIPKEWEVRPLLKAVRIANGQVDPRIEPYKSMILVAPDHIEGATGCLLDRRTASEQCAISGKYLFNPGDIVYSKIRPYLRKAIVADFGGLCSADMYPLKPAADVSPKFILAVLLGHNFSKYAESVSVRSGMPKINRAELAEYSLALPPPKEQRAIAAALSDVDALIGALDKLVAKKRGLKQAAMQQLLTGQTRLPGFSGNWKAERLGNVATFRTGPFGSALHKSDYIANGLPVINPMHIIEGQLVPSAEMTITQQAAKRLEDFILRRGDLIIGRRGDMGRCAVVQPANEGWLCGTGSLIVRCSKAAVPAFMQRVLSSPKVITAIEDSSVGSTMINLNQKVLGSLQIQLPTNGEQSAIASILSDMDAEIATLEARRDKTRAVKQGMMQELLTGRTRLV